MELLMSVLVGVLFMVGTYLILTKSILRVVLGLILMSHGAHLLLLTMARLKTGAPPLLGEDALSYTDPLPQALILTAIVISFGVTAFLLVLAYRTYKEHQTDNLDQLRGSADE
ncbi:NADH-ubiquinone oxidoreductase chain 4L [Caldalkalibacillus thermarum TA2.A1]|uniref:NADH-ubiquinone oxidoreductase chain 4L n=1 Tax=Caldalkalibacillus thermarum (strain TA2.A1) TaxID=986075 RepID=F5L8P4_CALTT|nr:Na(+)/H(+) antiporter subunit C [Caldalkalibacillus thermarum]EGL82283.1 NADH-ubiquinone oxidoreductase chain 4L [Caldalkalibacillus thermarum TA2.A1]QZT33424.1 Na(+)/H(+) antiporter subunit C [Caldalkalibacillus thermarum TA2.A1]GGK18155.1 Na(+)/H(+) antiporter subunit C [Caldalkalibacillus thermarum]